MIFIIIQLIQDLSSLTFLLKISAIFQKNYNMSGIKKQ